MTEPFDLEVLAKNRILIFLFAISVFIIAISYSYSTSGRYFTSTQEYYLNNPVILSEFENEGKAAKTQIFYFVEDLEILKSICLSNEVLLSIVIKDSLIEHYNVINNENAVSELKKRLNVSISKQGKFTINLLDVDKLKANKIANNIVKEGYNNYLNLFKRGLKENTIKSKDLLKSLNSEKETLINSLLIFPEASKKLIAFELDSLKNDKAINQIQDYTKLSLSQIVSVINSLHRIKNIEARSFKLNDMIAEANKTLSNPEPLSLILISTNDASKLSLRTLVLEGIKYTILSSLLLLGVLFLIHNYKAELKYVFTNRKD